MEVLWGIPEFLYSIVSDLQLNNNTYSNKITLNKLDFVNQFLTQPIMPLFKIN